MAEANLRRQWSMEDLERELQCSVCLELFKQPTILPCSHILCRTPCAERLFQHNFIRCPVCRDNCYVAGGADSLPRVLTLENIIERYQADTQATVEDSVDNVTTSTLRARDVPCQLCHCNPRKAAKSCIDCNASYCNQCLELSHPAREPFCNHVLVSPKRHPRPKEVKCMHHGEVCSMYCESCRQLVCMHCLLENGHVGHSSESIDVAYKKMKKQHEDNISLLENSFQVTFVDAIKTKQDFLAELKDIVASRRANINEECDALIAEVEDKRRFFLSDLESEEEQLSLTTSLQIHQLQKNLADCQNLSHYAAEVLEESDFVSFLQLASGINHRILRKTPAQIERGISSSESLANLNNKMIDLRKEKLMVSQMKYITAPGEPVVESRCSASFTSVLIHLSAPNHIVDCYRVAYYCEESEEPMDVVVVTTSDHGNDACQPTEGSVILLDNLRLDSVGFCIIKAWNMAGEGSPSGRIPIGTITPGSLDIPIPEIRTTQCRTFTTAIHIYSPSTIQPRPGVTYFLLFREASGNKTWRMRELFSRPEHRLFGLSHNKTYECAIWASDGNGQGVKSSHVFLTTESVAEANASSPLTPELDME